ncbi:MAG TPA: 4'-phosphopantetheinyl transferase superfamily protein [Gemmatimonadota bacterium]|nr:4'-phosphopantetheinyl transferase superfamily protein [Gemmatimonadota bacterium]
MQWEELRQVPDLAADEVHVWRAALDLGPAALERAVAVLSTDERRRAGRFRFAVHRDRFVASRAVLRSVLGDYLNLSPAAVPLIAGPAGKPVLPPGRRAGVEFNLTHSGDRVLIAVTRGRSIGIDLERMRRGMPIERLAGRFFTPREAAELRAVPAAVRPAAFFACWTRKEAVLKAAGGFERGLPAALKGFVVSVAPPAAPGKTPGKTVVRTPGSMGQGQHWTLIDLAVGRGYAGALAVEGRPQLRLFEWVA